MAVKKPGAFSAGDICSAAAGMAREPVELTGSSTDRAIESFYNLAIRDPALLRQLPTRS